MSAPAYNSANVIREPVLFPVGENHEDDAGRDKHGEGRHDKIKKPVKEPPRKAPRTSGRVSTHKSKRHSESSSESEDDDQRVLSWIPLAEINIEVLVFYVKKYLGNDSDVEPGKHPRNADIGYFLRSRLGLSTVMVHDLREDSAAWKAEKARLRLRGRYEDSATAARRQEQGPSGQPTILKAPAARQAQREDLKQPMQTTGASAMSAQHQTTARYQDPRENFSYGTPYAPPLYNQQDFGPPGSGGRHAAQPNVNVTFTSSSLNYSQNQGFPSMMPGPPLSSIKGRLDSGIPAYEEADDRAANKPSTPISRDAFSMDYKAGSRHNRY